MSTSRAPKNDTQILPQTSGAERLQEIIADIEGKGKFLPTPVGIRDLDASLLGVLREGALSVEKPGAEGGVIPVIWQQSERSGAEALNWAIMDQKTRNITPPFVSVLRGNELPGTLYGTRSVVPQNQSFTYLYVPTFQDGVNGMERWKVPQPTPIDIPYAITIVARLTRELNPFVERYTRAFASLQLFISVNGHSFPMTLKEGDKNGTMEEIDGDRYYLKTYNLLVQAYLLDEKEYTREEVKNRRVTILETDGRQFAKLIHTTHMRLLRSS